MQQPNVPWYIAAVVAGGIAVCGYALASNDPNVTFLTANVKFLIGSLNAVLGAFAIYLNISKDATKP